MTDSASASPPKDERKQFAFFCGTNIAICKNISHLIYRLHGATRHTSKFVLLTACYQLRKEFLNCKITSKRLIMALDPEFLGLILRSSPAIANSALYLILSLTCDEETVTHLSTLLPHVALLLSSLFDMEDFKMDPITFAMLMDVGCTFDLLKAHLASDCLSFFMTVSSFMGVDVIHKVNMDIPDLEDSVDDLNDYIFNLKVDAINYKNGGEVSNKTKTSFGSDSTACDICSLISKRDYKEASIQIEQLHKDLDTLAAAHLEEIKLRAAEAKEYEEDGDLQMGSLLLKVGETTLKLLAAIKDDSTKERMAKAYISSIQSILTLIPSPQFSSMLEACIASNNFDIMNVLFQLSTEDTGNFANKDVQVRISNYAVTLLEKNLQKMSVALVGKFLANMLFKHGLKAIHYTKEGVNFGLLMKRISTVLRRSEIEIHLVLDDFLRRGKTSSEFTPTFILLESLFTHLSDNEALLPPCHDIFTTIHRIINTVFEFFDEVTREMCKDNYMISNYCSRLVGCWMTLEPLHLKSVYLKKLPKILSVISVPDVIWLLPTFERLDVVDLEGIDLLIPTIVQLLHFEVVGFMAGETPSPQCSTELTTMRFSYRLMERLFLEGMNEGVDAFMSIDESIAPPLLVIGFDYRPTLEKGNVHFNPTPPLGMSIPLCMNVPKSSKAKVRCLVDSFQWFLIVIMYNDQEKLRRNMDSRKDDHPELKKFHIVIQCALSSFDALQSDWSMLLCETTLATASACLCRFHQSVVRDFLDDSMVFIIMECLATSFAYTCPQTAAQYVDYEDWKTFLWYRISLCCTVLLQRQPTFINILALVCRQLKLKVPSVKSGALDKLVEEGCLSANYSTSVEFMCTLVTSIR